MGHHSFLDSLKSIGNKIVQVAHSPIVASIASVAKFTPTGALVSILTNPAVDAQIGSALKSVGNEVKVIGNEVKKDVISVGNTIKSDIGSAFKFMEYIPYIGGGLVALYVYSKVR